MIITKSVSRFARNIVDCVTIVRKLKAHRPNAIGVFFETEHIFTLKDNSEMSLNFTATMAQEESHVKSQVILTYALSVLDGCWMPCEVFAGAVWAVWVG